MAQQRLTKLPDAPAISPAPPAATRRRCRLIVSSRSPLSAPARTRPRGKVGLRYRLDRTGGHVHEQVVTSARLLGQGLGNRLRNLLDRRRFQIRPSGGSTGAGSTGAGSAAASTTGSTTFFLRGARFGLAGAGFSVPAPPRGGRRLRSGFGGDLLLARRTLRLGRRGFGGRLRFRQCRRDLGRNGGFADRDRLDRLGRDRSGFRLRLRLSGSGATSGSGAGCSATGSG